MFSRVLRVRRDGWREAAVRAFECPTCHLNKSQIGFSGMEVARSYGRLNRNQDTLCYADGTASEKSSHVGNLEESTGNTGP